jgi:GGDEF domain-containing protein
MQANMAVDSVSQLPATNEFAGQIQVAIEKSRASGRPFFILIYQFENIEIFKKRRTPTVLYNLFREVGQAVRRVVHPSQFVGRYNDGLGLVFDAVELGEMDTIAHKLGVLIQNVIRVGKYNDLSGRWTDIIYQFLHPNNPGMIYPKVGWAVYPRDGQTAQDIMKRAFCHIKELSR